MLSFDLFKGVDKTAAPTIDCDESFAVTYLHRTEGDRFRDSLCKPLGTRGRAPMQALEECVLATEKILVHSRVQDLDENQLPQAPDPTSEVNVRGISTSKEPKNQVRPAANRYTWSTVVRDR
jgi:hypothetical protein